jgi:UDPglucose 6-dehydrogenase
MRSLYSHFIRNGHAFVTVDVRSSEMSKYAANVMLATRISLMNELALMCDRVGADVMSVRKAIGTDKRIGMAFLYPGIGFGGSCFPKDVKALSRMAIECDSPGNILDAVERVNRYQRVMLANRIVAKFGGDVRGKRFALWGLAFKPKTDDIREAPAITIVKRLTDAGAEICAYDPEAMENAKAMLAGNPRVTFAGSHYEAVEGADALVLATEWALFRKPDWDRVKAALRQPIIFDGRNQYEPAEMAELGFDYTCIGRPQT